jgi:hypothetical protein
VLKNKAQSSIAPHAMYYTASRDCMLQMLTFFNRATYPVYNSPVFLHRMAKRFLIMLLTGMLTYPLYVGAAEPGSPAPKSRPRIEQHPSPDDRNRMRRELNNETEQAYPDRDQVENRREQMRERLQERFNRADVHNDRAISREEANRTMPGMARHFDQIDTNRDGTISREELRAARERLRDQHQAPAEEGSPQAEPMPRKPLRPQLRGNNAPPPEGQ